MLRTFQMPLVDSTILLFPKSEVILCGYTVLFLSHLVGIPEDRFSRDATQIVLLVVKNNLTVDFMDK